MNSRVLVAMSGGVDSSVAALLLKEQGYEVVGAHMKLWDYAKVGGDIHRDGRCCSLDAVTDCRFVCDRIGAPFFVFNLSAQFRESVIENFVSEYKAGRTPNPCVRCNTEIKWAALLHKALELGCDRIATGHYAQIVTHTNGRLGIRKGVDSTRDQSYVLWGVTQEALARTIFPLGELTKSEVRDLARKAGLRTAEKAESREICFVADNNYHRFLREYDSSPDNAFTPGEILHENGRTLGRHDGTAYFTVGQRKGMGISNPTPLYVQRIEPESRRVIVGEFEQLLAGGLVAEQVNWVAGDGDADPFEAEVKIRYLHKPMPATVIPLTVNSVRVMFESPQRAITPGQTVVFYDGDLLLGGGVIAASER